jgi:hypothetical protein
VRENVKVPALRQTAAHNASGIMIESAQIAMTRLIGPGRSTVCLAKSPVVSAVVEPKMSLPDTHPP